MRLHRLEVAAFGPFATSQAVDFDALAEHGLFLLNGATGAGKTSVLDAVCFALYGGLPGARQGSKALKSHHAEAGAEPVVELEFTAQGRRFEVRRTPAWDKPSARSKNGFTTQQASTHLRELVDGQWIPRSARNDEAAALLRDVLGMDREQFTRVAMLPQGEFATFLQADPKDREKLLESLFATGRYADVEVQLSTMAQEAEAKAVAAEQAAWLPVRQLEAELASHGWSDSADGDTRLAAGELSDGLALFHAAGARFGQLAAEEASAIERAREAVASARAREEDCRREADDAAELAAARERRARWGAKSAEHAARIERLRRAAAASALRPHLDADRRARDLLLAAETELRAAEDGAAAAGWSAPDDGELAPGRLRAEANDARARSAILAEQIPLEDELEEFLVRQSEAVAERENARRLLDRLDADRAAAEKAEAELVDERARLEPVAAARLADERDEQAAREVLDAVQEHRMVVGQLGEAERGLVQRRTEALACKEKWLDLREQRLEHTAFELAARLEDGIACPVCGSESHPHPAVGEDDPLRLVDLEKEAAAAAEDATERERRAAAAVAEAKAALAAVVARGGAADPDKAARALDEAAGRLRAARAAEERLSLVTERLSAMDGRRRELAAQREAAARSAAVSEATLGHLEGEIQRRRGDLSAWRAGWPSLRGHQAALDAVVRALEPLAEAAAALVAARTQAREAAEALESALAQSPFPDALSARAALLDDAEAEALRSAVEVHTAEEQVISGLLSSAAALRALEVEKAAPAGRPAAASRLEAFRSELARCEAELAAAHTAEHSARSGASRCERLGEEFSHALPAFESARARADLLGELQRTARGSGENRLRMSLHRYVLAARLEQVAVAATERLAVMSDGRFSLEHSDALAARGAASGLGLEVLDAWTGQRRDPATLSGGESFMASLALALGLADVVQHEAGGVDIETLFVDEGFGTLDEQTLEQVMEAIEGLRDGGRTVGIVSHVAELKQRIPAQIKVSKGRSGSTLTVVAGRDALAVSEALVGA